MISPLVPGRKDTYTYDTEESYNAMLDDCCFAYTWKKGGWDCFRHVEILAHGCIPLIPTIDEVPPYSLAMHNIGLYREIWHACKDYIKSPSKLKKVLEVHGDDWQRRLRAQNLTTDTIFKYILNRCKSPKRIFWIDHRLNQMFDYMSALVYIGAMESGIPVTLCSKAPSVLYDKETTQSQQVGHGLGFNYQGYFQASAPKHSKCPISELTADDLVIFGSFARSHEDFSRISSTQCQIACIVGEDTFVRVPKAVLDRAEVFMRESTIHNVLESAKYIPLEHLRPKSGSKIGFILFAVVLAVIVWILFVKRR
jgi:hypothetical protein